MGTPSAMDRIIARDGGDLRRRLKSLPPERRRALQRALWRGDAVEDPRDAELAAEVAARRQALRRLPEWNRPRWVFVFHAIGLVGAVVALVKGEWLLGGLVLAVFAYLATMSILFNHLAEKASLAEHKNRALARSSGDGAA